MLHKDLTTSYPRSVRDTSIGGVVQLARAVQRIEFVATADMGFADEYLRKGRTHADAVPHFLTKRRVLG